MSLHSVEREIYEALRDDPDVKRMTDGRVYYGLRPQDDIDPGINFMRAKTENITTLAGRSCVAKGEFQISCWARNLSEAVDLKLYSKRALDRLNSAGAGGIVQSLLPVDEFEIFWEKTKNYRAVLEVEVMYREPI